MHEPIMFILCLLILSGFYLVIFTVGPLNMYVYVPGALLVDLHLPKLRPDLLGGHDTSSYGLFLFISITCVHVLGYITMEWLKAASPYQLKP